jgi:hypothetical protein
MTSDETARLRRENAHLMARCDALQGEVWDLSSRLARALKRLDTAAEPRRQRRPETLEEHP